MQVVLDRGEEKDWCGSGEIIIATSESYLFLLDNFTAREPFVRPPLLRDRNFIAGMLFVAIFADPGIAADHCLYRRLQAVDDRDAGGASDADRRRADVRSRR